VRIRLNPNRVLAQPLETERFRLVPLGIMGTLRLTAGWRHDPDIVDGVLYSANLSRLEWLRRGPFPDNVDRFTFAIIPKGQSEAIGLHSIRLFKPYSARNMVGISDRAWWGKDVVVEVRARLMNHFFRHAGVDRFCGATHSRNPASIFTYQKLGYDHVGTQHKERVHPVTGELLDLLLFEMFRDKWARGPFADGDLGGAGEA